MLLRSKRFSPTFVRATLFIATSLSTLPKKELQEGINSSSLKKDVTRIKFSNKKLIKPFFQVSAHFDG